MTKRTDREMLASLYRDAFFNSFVSMQADTETYNPETYKLYQNLWGHYLAGPETPEKCVPNG